MNSKLKALRPTYAEIDLPAFGRNLETARQLSGTDVIAIVKADAYSHGELEVCTYAYTHHNCTKFAVATFLEGLILREQLGDNITIFVLGYIDPLFYEEAYQHNLILTINDNETAAHYNEFLQRHNLVADVTIKINTGMNRLGFRTDMNWYEFTVAYPALRPIHYMSHLSSSDSDKEYTLHQIEEFDNFLKKNKVKCHTSMLNSSGIAGYENKFSLCRPGIMLYGYLDGGFDVKLEKVMRIYSRIVQIQYLHKGEPVSYGQKYHAERDMAIGVVPIGYADGYPRCLSNKGHVFVDGVKCKVIGTVCMDMVMVDLTGVDLNGPLKVEVLGDNIDADELAELAGTISYEILTGIQNRIPRIYIEGR
jgi:alanine racemase